VIRAHGSRDTTLLDGRVRVRQVEVIDVAAELPLQRALLAEAEEVRLLESDEAADTSPLPDRRSEIHAPGPFLLHAKDDVDVSPLVCLAGVWRRQRRVEESEVRDVVIAANQQVLVEHVTRQHEDLLANARLGRDVVAEDLDAVHDCRLPLLDVPPEIDDGYRVPASTGALDHRRHRRVDVAFVGIRLLDASRRLLPLAAVEELPAVAVVGAPEGSAQQVAKRFALLPERIEAGDLVSGKARRAGGLERPDAIAGSFVDTDVNQRLAARPLDEQCVARDAGVDEAAIGVEGRNALGEVTLVLVLVELALPPPEEALRLRLHRLDDGAG
jgi:hypothetical protein